MPDSEKTVNTGDKPEKKSRKEKKLEERIAELEEQLTEVTSQMEDWKNKYYQAYADTRNLRSSLEKDHHMFVKYRAEGFIDGLYMALGNEPTDPALKNYLVGFQYIYRNLVAALENEGVNEITPEVGAMFDSSVMNAVDAVEVEDPKEVNKIVRVYSKGYKLHDRLIRPANVVVNKLKEAEKQENNEQADA